MAKIIFVIVLGIVQGLTEFLPVSSSGHIELVKFFWNKDLGEQDILLTVLLHAATSLSTIVVFRKDILDIIKGLFVFKWNKEWKYAINIALSMIPVAIVGLFFKDVLEEHFFGNALLVGCMLLVTGALLSFTYFYKKTEGSEVNTGQAIAMGIVQAIAVLPGISRSGSTIAIGLLVGVDKAKAARFSFLMVLVPILGDTLLEVKDLLEVEHINSTLSLSHLAIGFLASFFVGLIACQWMVNIVKKGKLIYFAIYCFLVGAIAVAGHFLM